MKRAEEARQLLEGQGLSGEELASAVDEVEQCINNKKTGNIISVTEALKFLPSYIHLLGLETNRGIKLSSDPVAFSETKPLSLPQMPVLTDLAPQAVEPPTLGPARVLDLSQFYVDQGPTGGWDAAAVEHSRRLALGTVGRGDEQGGRVIKERREEEGRSGTFRLPVPTFGKNGSASRAGTLRKGGTMGRTGTMGKSGTSFNSRQTANKIVPIPDHMGETGHKVAVVQKEKVARERKSVGHKSTVPVQEVSFSPRLETDPEEEEGPFRFQAMLRRTNVLPTDSLRRRRGGPPKPMGEEVLRLFGGSLMPPLIAPTAAEVVL